jgi:signal peptidase I
MTEQHPYASPPITGLPPDLPPSPSNNQDTWRSVLGTILIIAAAPLIALVLITYVFQSYEVDGPSMQDTLENHDRLIVDKIPRSIARITNHAYIPSRGEIIIFTLRGSLDTDGRHERQLIKRVIGVPGDHVTVRDGVITIYNSEHPGGYNPDTFGEYRKINVHTPGNVDIDVGEGEVFVCGDNRVNSLDSRSFGTISANDIVGKLSFRIYPLSDIEKF